MHCLTVRETQSDTQYSAIRYKWKAFLVKSLKLPLQIIHLGMKLVQLSHRWIIHTKNASLNRISGVNV